jgi:cell division protein ZipA
MSQEFSLGEPQTAPWVEAGEPAARVVGTTPSEDASHLLPPLTVPPRSAERDYGPRPWLEYVIDLVGEAPYPRAQLLSLLPEPLLEEIAMPELYGRPVGEEAWTFVRASGVPEEFRELAVGWNMAPREGEAPTVAALRRYRDLLAHRLRPLGRKLRPRELPERAAQRGAELARFRDHWDVGVALVLRAPWLRRYDAREVWDAACSLGLEWGHLEIFHWHNRMRWPGDDHLFSLWSLEAPGSFSPEEVAAGMTTPELALGFSIPRSPDPMGIFERMVTAGRYMQSRLGGKLLLGPVSVLSEVQLQLWRARIRTAMEQLTQAGFPPGAARTMQLF